MSSVLPISRVVVLCVGNICRSPMAEALLKERFRGNGMNNVEVRSAGIATVEGRPVDESALQVMHASNLDLTGQLSQRVSSKLIAWAELILVMEDFQKQYIESEFPQARGKVFLIGHWRGIQIPDPYRGHYSLFEASYQLLSLCSDDWVNRLSVSI